MPEDYLPGLMPIVHAALQHGPSMIIQQISVAQSEASLLGADSVLYPNVSAGAGYGISEASVGVGSEGGAAGSNLKSTSTSANYNIGISQPLWQWGANWNATRIAKLQLLITQKAYAETYRTLILTLRDSYLGLVRQKRALHNAQANLKIVEDNLAVQEIQLKAGMIANGQVLGPQLLAADTHLAYDKEQEDYLHAKHLLALLAGVPDLAEDTIPDGIPSIPYDPAMADQVLAECLRDGAKSTFQAETYDMYIRQQKLQIKINDVAQLPKFNLSAGYGLSNSTSISLAAAGPNGTAVPSAIAQEAVTSETVSVGLGWDIFDGWRSVANIRAAKLQKRNYERTLQTYVESTLELVQDYRRQLDFAARAMTLAERRRALAQIALDQATNDHKLGVAPQSAVDNNAYLLYVSDYALSSARADFLTRWSYFLSYTGADPALGLLPPQYVRVRH